jgi:uncharacterized lipoprotein NlpE involved in copper resistance
MKKSFLVFSLSILTLLGCNNYGDKVSKGHVDIYYKDGIDKKAAQHTAEVLYSIDSSFNNNTTVTKSFQLINADDTITFRMVVNEEQASVLADDSFLAISNIISENVFDSKPVNIELTDNRFNSLRKLSYQKMDLSDDASDLD